MSSSIDQMREALTGLIRAREVLETQLAGHGPWQALRQLVERERKGDAVAAVDGARLRAALEQRLDQDVPFWRAWAEVDIAIARIGDAATIPAPRAPDQTVKARPLAAPVIDVPIAPTPTPTPREVIRPRIKIKAASSVIARDPEPGAPKALVADAPVQETGNVQAEAPEPVTTARRSDLERIRIIDRRQLAEPDVPVQPLLRADQPSMPVEARDPIVPRSKAKAVAPSEPAVATPSEPAPEDRLAALEADLDEIMGQPRASSRSAAARRDDAADGLAGHQVEEADVSIVAIRRELLEPDIGAPARSGPASAPPVALSIRLKQDERAAELDSDDYAAYLTDVGEAEVEIVRLDRPAGEPRETVAPAGRPVLKLVSRD